MSTESGRYIPPPALKCRKCNGPVVIAEGWEKCAACGNSRREQVRKEPRVPVDPWWAQ